MVHKKYKYKNGKRYGPYYYENKRVGNKVITTYLGANYNYKHNVHEKHVGELGRNNIRYFYLIAGILLLFSFFSVLYFIGLPPFFSPEIKTLEISLDKESFNVGEQLNGQIRLSLRGGELIPFDSKILLSYNGIEKEINVVDYTSIEKV